MSADAAVNDRLRYLEDGFKLYRTKMDSLCKEMKILVAEINIITEWIHGSFGIELINKKSFLYKHIHDIEDVQEISEALTMLAQQGTTRTTPINATTTAPLAATNGTLGIYNPIGAGPPPPRPPPSTTPRSTLISIPISTITSSPSEHSIRNETPSSQFILPISPPPSTNLPPSPPPNSRPLRPIMPTTPGRPPSLPPSISLFHQPSPTGQHLIIHGTPHQIPHHPHHHNSNNSMLISTIPPSSSVPTPASAAAPSQPISIPISLTLPRGPLPRSTLTISKKHKPDQQRSLNVSSSSVPVLPMPPVVLKKATSTAISSVATTTTTTTIPTLAVALLQPATQSPAIIVPLNTTNHMPLKKNRARINYQTQQQQQIQLQPQNQADILKYFKPVGFEQRQEQRQQPALLEQQQNQSQITIQQHQHQSEIDEEASQEQRHQKAALQLLALQLEGRPPPQGHGHHETAVVTLHHGGINHKEVKVVNVVEEAEVLIDVGTEVEVEIPEVITPVEHPRKTSRKKLNFSKVSEEENLGGNKNGNVVEITTTGGSGGKRQSPDVDYSADADDEGISSDSTPAALNKTIKVQKDRGEKPKKAAVSSLNGGNKRSRSRTPVASITSKTTNNATTTIKTEVIDGERPSTSKLSYTSGVEEESSSGKPPEKLPKRGRPKKKPEDRVRTYDPRVPMMCDECGKVLKGSGALRVHKQIHANIRPHECKECGKAFRRKHHLEFHMMIHAGDKKETCSYCGKAFLIRRDLARHERTHTGEKPYGCHLCPKSFNVKQHLTLHIRTHTGERPYRCIICEKTFTQANSLRIHKKIHLRDANNAANGTLPANNKKGGGGGGGSKSKQNSTTTPNSNANASTSGVSSACTSALETPTPERAGEGGNSSRAPSRANSVISMCGSEQQSYHGSGRPFHSQSPSPNSCSSFASSTQHQIHQQYHLGRAVQYEHEHDHPPPVVGETVVVVTSPLPPAHAHQNHQLHGHGQLSPTSPYHNQYNSSFMNPSPWRLALNPGSGTNLLHSSSRSPTPPPSQQHSMPQPLPAHCSNPSITVIRPLTNRSGGQTHARNFIPSSSPSHNSSGNNFEPGRRSPGGRSNASSPSSNQNFPIYDQQHVTRFYQ